MAVRYCSKGDVFLDSSGNARNGGKLNFYITATTTRKNTYTVDALTVGLENANPVVLDSSGRCTTDIFLSAADYKVVLTNSDATDSITDDPVHGTLSATLLGIGMTPVNVLDITLNQNNNSVAKILNSNAGTGATAEFRADNGTAPIFIRQHGTGFTPSGIARADGGLLSANGAGGLTIATGAAQPIYFAINSTYAGQFDISRNFLFDTTGMGSIGSSAGAGLFVGGWIAAARSAGEAAVFSRMTSDGSVVLLRRGTTDVGSISVTASATAYNTSSDASLKEDIKPAADVGALFDTTPVSEFNWIETGEKQVAGFVAQDLVATLAPIVPGLVNQRENGLLEYDPSKLVPLLWREVQSLRARLMAAGIA